MSQGHSWREQRRAVVMTDVPTGKQMEFVSLWEASHMVACTMLCQPDTARKEIKKSITTGCARYGSKWRWKNETLSGLTKK